MAKKDEITTKFKVDVSDLKKGITEATNQIKLADATFKAATAGMDSWSKSTDGLKAKLTQLDSTLSAQKAKLENYTEQLKRQESAYAENGKRIETIKAQLAQLAEQGVSKTSAEYKKLENALASCEKEQDSNEKSVNKLKLSILEQQGAINKTEADIGKYSTALNNLEKDQNSAADAAKKQASAYESLEKTIADQQKNLDDLKSKYASVVLEQGKNSSSAKDLAGQIDKLSTELNDNKTKLNEADKAADEFDKSLDDLGDSAEESSGSFGSMTVAIGNLISQGIQMAIGAIKDFATETINVGKEFDKSMSNVAALSGATGDELQMLRDTAKEFGSTTQFSASQAADALGYMALAGWDANQSADALGGVLDLAAASGMDLAAASDMVTDYMSAFGMEADQSAYFADLLAYAQANANTTAQGLGEAFKNSAANMNAAGQDIETVTSLLSMMANQGLKGSEAGTALTAIMRDMTAKALDLSDAEKLAAFEAEGFTSVTGDMNDILGKNAIMIGNTLVPISDMNGNYRDLTDILRDVESATNGMGDAQKATALMSTFTSDSIKGLNLILNAGVDEAARFETQLRGASVTIDGFTSAASDMGLNVDEMKKALEEAGISTEEFEKALKTSEGSAENFIDSLDEWSSSSGPLASEVFDKLGISVEDLQTAMDNSSGSAATMAAVMNDNLNGDLTALGSKLEGVQIALYEKFEPALRAGVDALSKMLDGVMWLIDKGSQFVDWLNSGSVGAEAFKVVVIALTAAFTAFMAVLGAQAAWTGLIALVGKLKAGFIALNATMAANPIGLVIAAVAALVAAFVYLWNNCEEFREFWINLWEKIKEIASAAWEAITGFFSAAWEKIKEIWGKVGDWFKETWEKIKEAFANVKEWFSEKFTAAKEGIQNAWSTVKDWFANVWNGIKEAFSKADSWMSEKFGAAWDAIKLIWNTVIGYFKNIWESIKKIFSVVKDVLTGNWKGAWEGIKSIVDLWKNYFQGIWDGIKNIFSKVHTWFSDKFSAAWKGIKEKFSPISKWFSDVWEGIKKIFKGAGDWFGDIFDKVGKAVKAPLNAVIKAMNKVIRGLNKISIDIPDWVPGVGGKTFGFNIGEIPELAQGGVLRRGQMGLLEGSGAEAVVPLEKNKQWIRAVANDLLNELQIKAVGGSSSNLSNSSEYNFTQIINAPKQPSRIELYRQTRNLLAYAKEAGGV